MSSGTGYDPKIIERFADQLLRKADTVRVGCAVGGGIFGVFVGAVPLTPLKSVWGVPAGFGVATIIVGALLGILLGYVIGDRTVLGRRAADLFKAQLDDSQCAAFIDLVNRTMPTELVMFDVQTDRASGGSGSVSISHYLYRALLRALDYAEDFDIAELEQSLEADGRLDDFVRRFESRYQGQWRTRRKMAQKMNEASAILHEMEQVGHILLFLAKCGLILNGSYPVSSIRGRR